MSIEFHNLQPSSGLRAHRIFGLSSRPTSLAVCPTFTDEYHRQLHALPHWEQAEIAAFPGGELARELAAKVIREVGEKAVTL